MAIAVPTGCQRAASNAPPAGAVRLDAHHDLVALVRMIGQQRVELSRAFKTFPNPSLRQERARLVQHADAGCASAQSRPTKIPKLQLLAGRWGHFLDLGLTAQGLTVVTHRWLGGTLSDRTDLVPTLLGTL